MYYRTISSYPVPTTARLKFGVHPLVNAYGPLSDMKPLSVPSLLILVAVVLSVPVTIRPSNFGTLATGNWFANSKGSRDILVIYSTSSSMSHGSSGVYSIP